MTDQQWKIIEALRDGPLDQFQIAASTALAPFTVRGELQALRRERLVRDKLVPAKIEWELTNRGNQLAWNGRQLRVIPGGGR